MKTALIILSVLFVLTVLWRTFTTAVDDATNPDQPPPPPENDHPENHGGG